MTVTHFQKFTHSNQTLLKLMKDKKSNKVFFNKSLITEPTIKQQSLSQQP